MSIDLSLSEPAETDRVRGDLDWIRDTICAARFQVANEYQLQVAIAQRLHEATVLAPLRARREQRLDGRSRIDFLTENGIGIEIKTQGTVGQVGRQVRRYVEHPMIRGLLLVTTVRRHLALEQPHGLLAAADGAKPFQIAYVGAPW